MKSSLRDVSNAAAANDWRAIPWIVSFILAEDSQLREQAVKAVDHLARQIPPRAMPSFETRLRESTWQGYSWHELKPHDARRQNWPAFVWAILTFHPNGYNREEAIRRIAADNGALLPFLLLRLNDWVPQVRAAAVEAVHSRLDAQHLGHWLPLVGLLDALQARSRHDHSWINREVAKLLHSSRPETGLEGMLQSREPRVARWALKAALTLPNVDQARFIELGLEHFDPMCRFLAAKAVRNLAKSPIRMKLLTKMKDDPAMNVRREAMYVMLDAPEIEREEWLVASLLDRHRSIREAARFYLVRDTPGFDVRGHYFDAIHDAPTKLLAAAVAGLGETGRKEDTKLLFSFVDHTRPKVAAAAVRAIAQLDGSSHVDWLVQLLADTRPTVAKEAMRALIEAGSAVPAEPIREILHSATQAFNSLYALKVLLRRHPYEALAEAIFAANHGEPIVAKAGTDFVVEYLRHPFRYSPTDAQRQLIEAALVGSQKSISEVLVSRVRVAIR